MEKPKTSVSEDRQLHEALNDIEEAMPRFARWLYSRVHWHLGRRVLDAGAGLGTYTELLLADGHEVVALEYNREFVLQLQGRFAGNPGVLIDQADLGDAAGLPEFPPVDSVLCLNVLEHVEDDLQMLKNLRGRVRPGGTMVILVPAYPRLYNTLDKALGHFRRYRKGEFEQRLRDAGWDIEETFRMNAFGVFGWSVAGLLRRETPGRFASNLFDLLIPVFSPIEKYVVRGLWGLSLVSICRPSD